MSHTPDILIKDFSFKYEETSGFSLRNINFAVQQGEFVLLAGASGCGKSTLLRCLNGIIPHLLPGATSGSIGIKGEEASALKPESIARHAGSVFQNPRSQFFHTNVLDEIAFGPENSGLCRDEIISRVDEAVELFGLGPLKDRKMYELSSGEQQKVSFAAIYAAGKDILFLDEPSANLDAQAVGHLKEVLARLKSKGKTILIAEHRLYYLADLFDKMVVMESGEIKKILRPSDDLRIENLMKEGLRALDLKAYLESRAKKQKRAAEKGQQSNLEAAKLRHCYPAQKTPALADVSCSFSRGEILAVVGANGSGKTTLIKLVAGLLTPKNGHFYGVDGKRLSSSKRLQNCGLVLQESSHQLFYPTVREELASAGADVEEPGIMDFLEELGLSKFIESHPQQLSAGQQQRLVFALAAVRVPKILILDEPTSGLDARSMRAIGKRIRKQAEAGSSVIIVTHDIEFINEFCDSALVMSEGKLEGKIPSGAFPDYFRNGLVRHHHGARILPDGQLRPLAV